MNRSTRRAFPLAAAFASLVVAQAPTAAFAQEEGAGCGLGAEVLEGKSGKGSNIAAALLNGLIVPNTTFMTTGDGIMGCDPTQVVEVEQVRKTFVASNLDQISTEAARGEGIYLEALASLMGVPGDDAGRFTELARREYDALFGGDAADASDAERLIDSLALAMADDLVLSSYVVR